MRIFVLGTGRCGTVTFARACEHLTNYTVGHESRVSCIGDLRFDYPDQHIEVDSRLPWFLGELGQRFPQEFFIHLRRDPEETAKSICQKWGGGRINFARAFGHAIVMHGAEWPEHGKLEVSRFQVRTMVANIEEFLSNRVHWTVWLHEASTWFPPFLDYIRAEGDLKAAMAEWAIRHNASGRKPTGLSENVRIT